jgi:hypothetical protein
MNKFNPSAFILLIVSIFIVFTSCSDNEDYNYFLIKVDKIDIPGEVFANEPFELKLSGTIGPDGCFGFERFIIKAQDSLLFIEPWGKVKLNSYACPQDKVELSKEKLKYLVADPGNYTLLIKQPDGSFFEQQLKVK